MQTFYLLARCQASCARWVLGRVVKQGLRALVLAGAVRAAPVNPVHADTHSPRVLLDVVAFSLPVVSPEVSRVPFRYDQDQVDHSHYTHGGTVQHMIRDSKTRRFE